MLELFSVIKKKKQKQMKQMNSVIIQKTVKMSSFQTNPKRVIQRKSPSSEII
jgi:hypothetical protein